MAQWPAVQDPEELIHPGQISWVLHSELWWEEEQATNQPTCPYPEVGSDGRTPRSSLGGWTEYSTWWGTQSVSGEWRICATAGWVQVRCRLLVLSHRMDLFWSDFWNDYFKWELFRWSMCYGERPTNPIPYCIWPTYWRESLTNLDQYLTICVGPD